MNLRIGLLSLSLLTSACAAEVQIKNCTVTYTSTLNDSHTYTKMVQAEPFSLSESESKIFSHEACTLEATLKNESEEHATIAFCLKENDVVIDEPVLVCAWDKKAQVKKCEKAESGESSLKFEAIVTR